MSDVHNFFHNHMHTAQQEISSSKATSEVMKRMAGEVHYSRTDVSISRSISQKVVSHFFESFGKWQKTKLAINISSQHRLIHIYPSIFMNNW